MAYDAIGNITSRSDVGSYTYHASKKHAVIAAGSNSYGYDNNGNMTTRNGASITWTSANLPATLNAAGYSATFSYAPDRARWRQVSNYASGTETTIYVGGLMEKLTTPVRTHWKHRIPTPSGQVQVIRRSDGTSETLYLTTDHLGSTETVLNAAGAVLARPSFAAWGGRSGSNWQGVPSPPEWQAIADTTRRGYTGHEHLDNVLLVHMNGRVYDPAIGRFLSADPLIDCLQSTQGWNRYSYVKNNPLAFTDPTGFSRIPPSAPVMRIDPVTGLPEMVVLGSRLDEIWANHRVGVAMTSVTTTAGRTGTGGGGGRSSGDGAEQREEEHKKCVDDCVESKTPEIYGLAAMAGALPTRNAYAIAGAGAVGYLAGHAKINEQSAVGPGIVGAMVGHVAAMLENRPTVAGVITAPASAIAADVVGNSFDGPSGALWGGAAGGAIDSLPKVASLLSEGAIRSALTKLVLGTAGPAATAYAGYMLATYVATRVCESDCNGP